MIDSIEAHVESAAVHVEEGNEHLGHAENFQRKSRKKMCILAGIVAGVLITLIIVLAVTLKD